MNKPNFFIIGAPKCGTTALSVYLSEHPGICISKPKEPHFFCTDLSEYRNNIQLREYLDYFNCAKAGAQIFGEASTWYMYSKDAVPNILKFNKDAKIVAMIRNPVQMAESLYYQYLYGYEEDAASFEDAWNLQESRAQGRNIPKNILEPQRLQYRKVCALGEQLERVMNLVPDNQLKIIVFDDFINDTKGVYIDVLAFLGLKDDDRKEFRRINEGKSHRLKFISDITQQPSDRLDVFVEWIKTKLGVKRIGFTNYLRKINQAKNYRPPLSDNFRRTLYSAFDDDIVVIERLLNRKLERWRS